MIWSQLPVIETLIISIAALLIWLSYTLFVLRKGILPSLVILRSSLFGVALLSLCFIIFKPQYSVRQTTGKALVLTEPITDIPDSLKVFALPDVELSDKIKRITDLSFIERNYPQINQLYIDGYNIDPEMLSQLRQTEVSIIKQVPPAGFNALSYNNQLKEGEILKVSGTFRNDSQDSVKLVLETAEDKKDSVSFPAGVHTFNLQARLHLTGSFTGTIRILQSKNIRTEPLPYIVKPKQPLRILIVQDFPVFETNYLKEWLAKQKHQVEIQSRISREKYSTQAINIPSESASFVAANTLKKADLLIIDQESLWQLTPTAQAIVRNAVQQGLGLLLLPDEKWIDKKEVLGYKFPVRQEDSKQFLLEKSINKQMVAEKIPAGFTNTPSVIAVKATQEKEIITAFLPVGKGRIGVQLASATFPWILNGEEKLYGSFWTDVIEALARKKEEKNISIKGSSFLWQQDLSVITVADSALIPLTIQNNTGKKQIVYPATQIPDLTILSYSFRTNESGWVNIYRGKDSSLAEKSYVLPVSAWKDLKQTNWWLKNQTIHTKPEKVTTPVSRQFRDIPLIWFFIIFVAATASLWWHERS